MQDIFNVLLLSFIGGVLALAGGVFFLVNKRWSKVLSKYSVPFAAGVLLTVALLGLLPEAYHLSGEITFSIVLVSFLASYFFEHFLFDIHHHEGHDHSSHGSSIPLVIVGDTLHNFIDGVAIATSYFISPGLGLVMALSTLLHEVPHEIGDFGILLKEGWSRKKVFLVNLVSASFSVVGALTVLFILPSNEVVGYLLAFATGMFLYLGASDFLPHIHEGQENPRKGVVALLAGVAIMVAIFNLVPHEHPEDDHGHVDSDALEEVHEDDDHDKMEVDFELHEEQ